MEKSRRTPSIRGMTKRLPKVGITMGDPAGIGSEITAKVLTRDNIGEFCVPIVIGDADVIRQGFKVIGADPTFEVVHDLEDALEPARNYVYDLDNVSLADYSFGRISAQAGRAAGESIERAIELAMEKKIDAIVTNPIHKESFNLGGYGERFPGHTEMLAALTGAKSYCMMLASGNLRVCHVTTHVSLLDALTRYITTERIVEVIKLADGQPAGVRDVYGMAEANWAAMQCRAGSYHIPPWIYARALDEDGRFQETPDAAGLLAFFDPYGGGQLFPAFFRTADQVRLVRPGAQPGDGLACPCGEPGDYIRQDSIQRVDLFDEAGCAAQV